MTATRGTTNGNVRGSSVDRAARKFWLLETYAADVRVVVYSGAFDDEAESILEQALELGFSARWDIDEDDEAGLWLLLTESGLGAPACRCYRCGRLLTFGTITVDRIVPGCQGGSYRRSNIRPACARCNSFTGGRTRSNNKTKARRSS